MNNKVITSDNFNDLYKLLIKEVLSKGSKTSPRGMDITEMIGVQFKLTNPRNSLCTLKNRNLGYKFSVVEKLEYAPSNVLLSLVKFFIFLL